MIVLDHCRKVYAAEAKALAPVEGRLLDRATSTELARRALGQKVTIVTLPDHMAKAGFIGGAEWIKGTPMIAVVDPTSICDLTLAHEIAHLMADRDGKLGHGMAWLRGYVSTLRSWHRHDVAHLLRVNLGGVVASQPASDFLAA